MGRSWQAGRSRSLVDWRTTAVAAALTLALGVAGAAEAKTVVTVGSWWSSAKDTPLDVLKRAFEAQHPDIEIQYTKYPADYGKVLAMIAAGTPPDIVMLGMDKLASWQAQGLVQDLRPLIKASGFNYNALPGPVRDAMEINGGVYALPRDITTSAVAYNKTLFSAAGLAAPQAGWTRDDFAKAAQALTQRQDGKTSVYGYAFDTFGDGLIDWLYTGGADFINADGTRDGLHEPAGVQVLTYLQNLVKEGAAKAGGASGAFGKQQAALYVTTIGWANNFAKDPALNWDVAPMPVWSAGDQPSVRLWTNLWTMPIGGKNPQAAFEVMAFFAGADGQKIVGETRMGIPSIPSVATGDAFLQMPGPPEHKRIFLDAIAYSKPFPRFVQSGDYLKIMTKELAPVWAGTRAVEDAVTAIDQQTQPLFAK